MTQINLKDISFTGGKQIFKSAIPLIEEEHNIKILYAFVRGSHLYGLNTPQSDVDITFIYQQQTLDVASGNYKPYLDISGTGDVVGFEIANTLELLVNANPTMLELLDVREECIIYQEPGFIQELKSVNWVSKKVEKSILGYAYSQVKKATGLNKKMNNPQPEKRKSILEFCYILHDSKAIPLMEYIDMLIPEYRDTSKWGVVKIPVGKGLFSVYPTHSESGLNFRGIIKDENSPQIRLSEIPKEFMKNHIPKVIYYNQDGFEVHCKQWKEYWDWVKNRNDIRYDNNVEAGQGVDLKNMMHLFRLLELAYRIGQTGKISLDTTVKEFLLNIKKGVYPYQTLLDCAEKIKLEIEKIFRDSNLPEHSDMDEMLYLLKSFRKRL